ncbi:MAG: class I SAM-dependent methyltransferase [Deltaproteobacteria bacterium]|nr:class I SAM-dependent methyltransferase [Deltaproteobacteria bacterium]
MKLFQSFKNLLKMLPIQKERTALFRDIVVGPYYQRDTFQDPYHANFSFFRQEVNKLEKYRILELGARNGNVKASFTGYEEYIGFDIHPGEGVDVVGDGHCLSKYFPEERFDAVMSVSVFEHLAMPWKVILELNRVMKTGGLLFIATHPTWPSHATPWDFWRYSKEAFKVLLNSSTGFEIIKNDEGLPCSILPFGHEKAMQQLHKQPANLGVSVVARKCAPYDKHLAWDVDITKILNSTYPVRDRATLTQR